MSLQSGAAARIGHHAAAGGDHPRGREVQAVYHLALELAEAQFAVPFKNLCDRQAGARLDLDIRVDEQGFETVGQQLSCRRLAGAHHADERDRSLHMKSPYRHRAGAIQIAGCWGKRPPMPRPRYDFGPQRRRRSPLPALFILLLVLIVGLLVYASTVDTEVAVGPIEQDVTNEVLAQ
jgi:hypothetical protein